MQIELKPHQTKALSEMKNGCVLCGGTGVGKGYTALGYFWTRVCGGTLGDWGSAKKPVQLYVITTAKKRNALDWQSEAKDFGISTDIEASLSGIKITVDSWNNIEKYKDVTDAFFIFDEQRVVGYGAWTKAFISIAKHNQWILLSATPGDNWIDYMPVFIANGFYKNKTDFVRQHVVYKPVKSIPIIDRYSNTGRLVRLRNQVLVQMPYERHTTRHALEIEVDYNEFHFKRVREDRWHVYEHRPLANVSELFSVMRRVVNSDASRTQTISSLATKHPRLIVFYNFDYELEQLRELFGVGDRPLKKKRMEEKIPSAMSQFLTGDLPSSSLRTTAGSTSSSAKSRFATGSEKSTHGSSTTGYCTVSPTPGQETNGHWTEDLGDGEMWVSSEKCQCEEMTSLQTSTSTSTPTDGSKNPGPTPPLTVAEWNGHRHDPVPTSDRWVYLVQYAAGAEGWNCITTDATVFYSLTYSYKHYHQAHGRTDRLNTPFVDLYYYTLVSKSWIDQVILKALRSKKSFNEASLGLKVA